MCIKLPHKFSKTEWMTELYKEHGNFKLKNITLPGSHDSCSYKLLKPWSCVPGVPSWTLTQRYSIFEQLQMGVRQFDIRVTIKDGTLYVSHTFMCGLLSETLRDLQNFAELYDEIILVSIKEDWEHRATFDLVKMYELIYKDFNKYIMHINNHEYKGEQSYEDMMKLNKKIIMVYDLGSYWFNKTNVYEWQDSYSKVPRPLEPNNCHILGFVLTPNKDYVVKNLVTSSLSKMAEELRPLLDVVIKDNWSAINGDFLDPEFINVIVDYNVKKIKSIVL